ncbi:MAG: hypothetical protein AAGA85_22760 [Bacteroidota bacterium]
MEPTKLTDTLKYIIIAVLLILASQGIAQSLPETTNNAPNALSPNTDSQELVIENAETISSSISFENDTHLISAEDIFVINPDEVLDQMTEEVAYFKVRRIVHKTKFAEERVVRKSYLA